MKGNSVVPTAQRDETLDAFHASLTDVPDAAAQVLRMVGKHLTHHPDDIAAARDEVRLRNGLEHILDAMNIHLQALR